MKSSHTISILLKRGVFLTLISLFASCDVQVIEVTETEFFITKEWKLSEAYWNNEQLTNNDLNSSTDKLENFRLKLNDDFTYRIINFDGTVTSGEWNLTSGLSQLTLTGFEFESWIIAELNIRNLDLRYITPPNKPNWPVRYVLEPIRGQ